VELKRNGEMRAANGVGKREQGAAEDAKFRGRRKRKRDARDAKRA
jgi:hypothetical protein